MDCSELNVTTTAESIPVRQTNEIIIAVPAISSTIERKPVASKRAAIISFEEDESTINNNILKSSTPPTGVSLADACLKYEEKQKLADERFKPFATDSTYERLHAEPVTVTAAAHANQTVYIEPESPTAIEIIAHETQTYRSLSNSFDYKETDSSMSKATDSSSITSTTTSHSSSSHADQVASQPSNSSMSSSVSLEPTPPNSPGASSSPENEYVSRIQALTSVENEHIHRIRELENRCATLEERVTALTL